MSETKGNKTITHFQWNLWEMEDTNGFYLIGTEEEATKWLNS